MDETDDKTLNQIAKFLGIAANSLRGADHCLSHITLLSDLDRTILEERRAELTRLMDRLEIWLTAIPSEPS